MRFAVLTFAMVALTAFGAPLLRQGQISMVEVNAESSRSFIEGIFLPGVSSYPFFPFDYSDPTKDPSFNWKGIKCNSDGVPFLYKDGDTSAKYIAMILHGNGMDLRAMANDETGLPIAKALKANLIAPEYPGYGQCPGDRTRKETDDLVLKFVQHLKNDKNIDLKKLILVGQSIGTGIATQLARSLQDSDVTIAGLVLISPYTSVKNMVTEKAGKLIGGIANKLGRVDSAWWNTAENIKKVKCPVIVLHGSEDDLIPAKMGKSIAGNDHTFVEMLGYEHNDVYKAIHDKYYKKIEEWLKKDVESGDDSGSDKDSDVGNEDLQEENNDSGSEKIKLFDDVVDQKISGTDGIAYDTSDSKQCQLIREQKNIYKAYKKARLGKAVKNYQTWWKNNKKK